ncbi:MAG: hypothetical protein A2Z74_04680 [Chloroflexi bacterium RBG_13_46_9]|nr:MAG: hypothetical protein A2Z74_04680 [Chloroflexi bacterium RBG_13_46_9]
MQKVTIRLRSMFSVTLINLVGKVGSGKTLFMTADSVNSGRPIYANYEIRHKKYRALTPELLMDPDLHGAVICLDEAYAWLESRTSGKDINRYMSYILFQSRKKDMDIYMTDQLSSTIDLRFREMLDWEIRCKVIPTYKHPKEFRYTIIDVAERKAYRFILPIENAKQYFGLYNTNQPISPIDDEMMVKISKSKDSILEQVDGIVDAIMNECPIKLINKAVIADFCIRNGWAKSYVDMSYNAFKRRVARMT